MRRLAGVERFFIHRQAPLAAAIVALGFGLRLYALGRESLWYDELLQLDIAQGPLATLLPRLRGHTGVPLDYLLTHFWIESGRSEVWVRFPAVVWGTLTLSLVYRLGKRLFSLGVGLVAMALLTCSPFHVQYSQEVRPYALLMLGVVLTVLAYWRLRETGHWFDLLLLQLGVLIGWLAHIFSLPIWGALLGFAVVDVLAGAGRKRRFKALLGLLVTGLLALAVLLALGWGEALFYNTRGFGEVLLQQPDLMGPSTTESLAAATRSPSITWPFVKNEILAPLGPGVGLDIPFWLVNGLVVAGLVTLLGQGRYKLGLFLLTWLVLPPVLIVAFLIFRDEFFAQRYLISILPAYLILLALPLWLFLTSRTRLVAQLSLVVTAFIFLSLGLGLDRLYHQQDKEDWRLVANFIAANAGPTDAVIAFRAEPTLNWYDPPVRAAPNFYDNLETIRQTVAGTKRSWIILSIFSSETDATAKAWLSEQGAIRLVLDPVIQVYYLGRNVSHDQLLAEIEGFALPVDHALYASLARENRHRPAIARRYYQLALEHAPDADTRAEYQAALEALPR